MSDDDFTVVPILASFDSNEPIGELRIKTSALPAAPNFVFSLGFQVLDSKGVYGTFLDDWIYVGPYKLRSVAIVPDDSYMGYLRQTKPPPA